MARPPANGRHGSRFQLVLPGWPNSVKRQWQTNCWRMPGGVRLRHQLEHLRPRVVGAGKEDRGVAPRGRRVHPQAGPVAEPRPFGAVDINVLVTGGAAVANAVIAGNPSELCRKPSTPNCSTPMALHTMAVKPIHNHLTNPCRTRGSALCGSLIARTVMSLSAVVSDVSIAELGQRGLEGSWRHAATRKPSHR